MMVKSSYFIPTIEAFLLLQYGQSTVENTFAHLYNYTIRILKYVFFQDLMFANFTDIQSINPTNADLLLRNTSVWSYSLAKPAQ